MKKDNSKDMKSLLTMAFMFEKENMKVLNIMIEALDLTTCGATITLLTKLLEVEESHVHSLEKYV